MKRRTIAFFAAVMLTPTLANADFSIIRRAEPIELSVQLLEINALAKMKENKRITYTPIDLKPYANRAFADDVAGDRKGGWSDQGSANDMREYNLFGKLDFMGIPFEIIPEGANANKSVLGLRGQNDLGIPNIAEIPIGMNAAGMYVLHSAPYGSKDKLCGRYSFVYNDGTSAYLDIISSKHVNDFWGNRDAEFAKCVWVGTNQYASQNHSKIHFTMLAVNNPHPEKKIEKLVLETEGTGPYLMIMGITMTSNGPYTPTELCINPADGDWKNAEQRDYNASKGTVLDVSYLLDAPAGKHGAVKAVGDGFAFSDGAKAKFWGTNLVGTANFPEKEDAELLAEALAQNGINLVRMTELDKYLLSESSKMLDKNKMDKLCYLISCFKEKGIYTYLTMTSKREAREIDGIEELADTSDGYKIEGFFEEKLIAAQKDYISKLLNYNNPYTGQKIGSDPAVCMLEFLDSNSIFEVSSRSNSEKGIGSQAYQSAINEKFNSFIASKYSNDYVLKTVWKKDYDFISGKGIGYLEFYPEYENSLFSQKHKEDTVEFMMKLHKSYYDEMNSYVKSLGFNGVTTASSNSVNVMSYGDAMASSAYDFSAKSVQGSYTPAVDEEKQMVNDSGMGYLSKLIKARPYGKPYMVSGWGTSMAAAFSGDSVIATAAVAAQQGWSACQYSFLNNMALGEDTPAGDITSIVNDTTRLGLMPAAALLFRSLGELDRDYYFDISLDNMLGKKDFEENASKHLFDSKVGTRFSQKTSVEVFDSELNKYRNAHFVFEPKDGVYAVRCANTEAVVGNLASVETQKHIDIYVDNVLSAVVLSAIGGKDIDNADRLLLTTVARTRNQGISIDRWFNTEGGGDLVTEPVTGKFILKLGECKVYALNFSGERVCEIPTQKDKNGNLAFEVNVDNSAVYYEISR